MHFPTKFLLVLLVRKQLNRNILMKRKLVLGSDAVVKCITFFYILVSGWVGSPKTLKLTIWQLRWSTTSIYCPLPHLHCTPNLQLLHFSSFVFCVFIHFCIFVWQAVVYQTTSMPLATQEDVEAAIAEVRPTQPWKSYQVTRNQNPTVTLLAVKIKSKLWNTQLDIF